MTEITRRDAMVTAAAISALALAGGAAAADADAPAAGAAAWDLTDIYPSDAAWEAERAAIAARLPQIAAYKGKLGESAATLRAALQLQSDIGLKVSRLYAYASLKRDEDLRVSANQERSQKVTDLATAYSEAGSWMGPEILTIGQAKIEGFLKADPALAKFRLQLEDQLRQAAHTLSPESEAILAGTGSPLAGPGDIRVQLVSSDIPRPEVTLSDGTKARLDDQGYTIHRAAPNRADRKLVFDQFWTSYKGFENSLGTALASQVKGEMFTAKARKYPSALDAALSGPNIPEAVYRTLIAETNKGLPVLHRYFDLRRRMLGLPDIAYYDIYPSLVKLDRSFSLAEMRTLTIEAVKPLGADYGAEFSKVTAAKWMDPRPRPGKQSGAYMNPGAYEVHPYLLLNLSDKYDGLTTYAHEWGHAMHSLLANKAQPWETANYPTFTAEIASTAHEAFLADYMLKNARTKDEKLFILGQMMENFRGTFFRQAMFAEFQLAIHDLAEKGEGLSGAKMTEINLALLKKYHGPHFVMDPLYGIEWTYIQHYFYGFYVFQYATSITAATYFAQQVLHGGAKERDNYLSVLRAGGSDYGYAILRKAGLDMATPTPYQTLIKAFSDVLDQAEALLGKA
ncbi:M3 family oligoendopeptidase [Sphingomonas sp. MMS24-J13]|uniref:M3 family oligoendopeptidase n=1 Tax=Sphingomonas sp. MMS24-J13 TaxID=3238686 RepID=UPI00384F104F